MNKDILYSYLLYISIIDGKYKQWQTLTTPEVHHIYFFPSLVCNIKNTRSPHLKHKIMETTH